MTFIFSHRTRQLRDTASQTVKIATNGLDAFRVLKHLWNMCRNTASLICRQTVFPHKFLPLSPSVFWQDYHKLLVLSYLISLWAICSASAGILGVVVRYRSKTKVQVFMYVAHKEEVCDPAKGWLGKMEIYLKHRLGRYI